MDGEQDLDGSIRDLVPCTENEQMGHLAKETQRAAAEHREPRNAYRSLPLTGCHQSLLPTYRLPHSFGCISELDEVGMAILGNARTSVAQPGTSNPW